MGYLLCVFKVKLAVLFTVHMICIEDIGLIVRISWFLYKVKVTFFHIAVTIHI